MVKRKTEPKQDQNLVAQPLNPIVPCPGWGTRGAIARVLSGLGTLMPLAQLPEVDMAASWVGSVWCLQLGINPYSSSPCQFPKELWPYYSLPGLWGFLLKSWCKPPRPHNSYILHACQMSTMWMTSSSAGLRNSQALLTLVAMASEPLCGLN